MSDLWPELETISLETNNTVTILREQAKIIDKKSNGAIKASFSKIKYKKNGLAELTKVANAMYGVTVAFQEDDELKDKTDINTLYRLEAYKFEIYSNTYKFRIFTIENRTVFPVYINIDEGIRTEIDRREREEIKSNKELEEVVSAVFHSSKIKTIISRMMEDSKKPRPAEEKKN